MTDLTKINILLGLVIGLSIYAILHLDGAIMRATLIGALVFALSLLIALDVAADDSRKDRE